MQLSNLRFHPSILRIHHILGPSFVIVAERSIKSSHLTQRKVSRPWKPCMNEELYILLNTEQGHFPKIDFP